MADSATVESEVAATAGSPVKKVNGDNAPLPGPSSNGDGPSNNGDPTKKDETSSPSKSEESEMLKKAMGNVAAGKRHLLVQDPNAAVASLAEACELLGKLYGETAKECGEAYFYYGKALLELARMEAGVIDNVLDGVPDTSEDEGENSFVEGPKPTEEEELKIADDVSKALQENYDDLKKMQIEKEAKEAAEAKAAKDANNPSTVNGAGVNGEDASEAKALVVNGGGTENDKKNESEENSEEEEEDEEENGEENSDEKEENSEEKEENEEKGNKEEAEGNGEGEEAEADDVKENESIGSNDAGTSDAKDSTDKVAQEQEEEEDPSNLQLAWEMLELAKGIFTKHADSLEALSPVRLELESKLSETYQTLGEVSIENENYPQAIDDLSMCLRRRQELLPEDSRSIAETHYQLGVALGFNAQFDEAVNALSDAISVLEKRIANLKECKESQDPSKKYDAFYTREREIKEIEGLIPEIKEKIADTKDMAEETIKKIGDRRLMEEAFAMNTTDENATTSKTKDDKLEDGATSSKKATTILAVKKRKKSEGEETSQNGDTKKPHLENGSTDATPSSSNGH